MSCHDVLIRRFNNVKIHVNSLRLTLLVDRNIGVWHDSITLQILPGINIKVQYIRYTSEYIPKLQIHQHSLLTRKVFSRHNLSAQVLFSISSRSSSSHLHLQVIFIVKSSSSSLDHHLIWSITGSSSSLDHHWIIIIITATIVSIKWCYLSFYLS